MREDWAVKMEPRIQKSDLLAGFVLAGMGGFILYKSIQLDYVNEFGPGPGFLPIWLGIALVVLAVAMVVLTAAQPQKEGLKKGSWVELLRGMITWVAFMVAIAFLEQLGFLLSFLLLTLFLVWGMNRRSPLVSLTVAVSSAVAFYVVFTWSLGISLPQGPLGF